MSNRELRFDDVKWGITRCQVFDCGRDAELFHEVVTGPEGSSLGACCLDCLEEMLERVIVLERSPSMMRLMGPFEAPL